MFETTLKRLVESVDGASGAAVLSLDGVVVEAVDAKGGPCALDAATVEYAQVLKQLVDVGDQIQLGAVRQFTVHGADRLGVVRILSPHYAVALNASADSIEGKAHFLLRVAAPDLAREL